MPLDAARIEEAAAFILRARASGEPYDALPEACRPATVFEGMKISERIADQLGRRTVAWKAGFSAPKQMADLGTTSPPWGRLFEGMLYESPASLPGRAYRQPLMEAEVAFRLGSALPSRAKGYTKDEVLDAVASAHLAIEGADVRYRDGFAAGLPSIVADSFAVQALVIGPEIPDWRSRDLDTLPVELEIDGEVKGKAFEGDARCRPVEVLVAMANDFSTRGLGFAAGQYVTTGAAAAPTLATPGQTVVARFPGIGEVVVQLAV